MKILSFASFLRRILFATLCFAFAGNTLYAQEQPFFEGTFDYKIEATGAQATQLKQNEPNNTMTMHLKEGNYIVQLAGGRYPKTFLFVSDSNYQYIVDSEQKAAFKYYPHADVDSAHKQEVKVVATNTGKTTVVNGEQCMIFEMKKADETVYFMVSDKYRMNTTLYSPKTRANANFLAPGLEGRIPLKIVRKTPGMTTTTVVSKITPRTFEEAQFRIPEEYEIKKRYYGM